MNLRSTIMLLGALAASVASAAPTLDIANGHYYDLINPSGYSPTWESARDDAASKSFFSGGKFYQGYLATVTSSAENSFIVSLGAVDGLYLGATYSGPSVGQYSWITGEAFSYTNWAGIEPNGDNGTIQYAVGGNGTWNDLPYDQFAGTTYVRGYVVEFSAVPGPAAAIPFVLGFLRRRRKQ